jgi:archaemetzincin
LFWDEKRTKGARHLLLVRSLGVLLHETCHIFGMTHCVYYRCLINGCNSMEESDRTPMHLCPVCLRKLQHSVGFNIVARYEALLKEYQRLRIDEEAEWLEKRLRFVKGE